MKIIIKFSKLIEIRKLTKEEKIIIKELLYKRNYIMR
jgi:hypothetical protein